MVQFIDDYRGSYGVELICRVLPIAPSTYYRAKDLEDCPEKRSLRSQHDDYYLREIKRIWLDSKYRHGVRKVLASDESGRHSCSALYGRTFNEAV